MEKYISLIGLEEWEVAPCGDGGNNIYERAVAVHGADQL